MSGLLKEIWLPGLSCRSATEVGSTRLPRKSHKLHNGVPIVCRTASNWRPGRGDCEDDEQASVRSEGHCGEISFYEEEEIRTTGQLVPCPSLSYNVGTTGQGSRWKVKNLTYKISQYPSASKMSPRDVDEEIAKALDVWAEVTDLTFQQKRYGSVHIEIKFAEAQHGDGDPFDGVGGTLAHAFFPVYGGDAHFDSSEKWTMNTEVGTNLLQTAAHEFGHSLGLSHSDKSNALMAPFYRGFEAKVRLDTDDINAITSLYGTKTEKNKVPSTIHFPDDDDTDDGTNIGELCVDSKFDTIAMTDDKETYVFKNNKYWKLTDTAVAPGYPKYIFQGWKGLPSNLDAAFTW